MEIIPAIMPSSYADLKAKAARVRGIALLAQIDIMDGVFVASQSWPYESGRISDDIDFGKLSRQDDVLPFWDELEYEIDLMIEAPELHIDEWLPLGAARLIFHIESIRNQEAFWGHAIFQPGARYIGNEKIFEVGIAIDPATPLDAIEHHLMRVDFVQCMGIAKIGYQGQPFDDRVLGHVNTLRAKHPNLPISIDGGVNMDTAKLLKQAGATRLVSGSAVFGASDAKEAITALGNA